MQKRIRFTKGGFVSVRGLNSSNEVHLVNALAIRGDEGRGRLRKVTASCQQALTRKCPNGETHRFMRYPVMNT